MVAFIIYPAIAKEAIWSVHGYGLRAFYVGQRFVRYRLRRDLKHEDASRPH